MNVRVRTILRHKGANVVTLSPDVFVYTALATMVEHNVGSVVLVDGAGGIAGIFTERDYLRRIALKGRTSRTTLLRQVMTAPVITVTPGHSVDDCLTLMTDMKCRHLPVVDDNALRGIISMGDCVKTLLNDAREERDTLEGFITGQYPR